MIVNYKLKGKSIEITNTLQLSYFFKLPDEYSSFDYVLQFEDFLIVSMFYSKKSIPDEKKRRNIWRISENAIRTCPLATVSWVIEDPYNYWVKEKPGDKDLQESVKASHFSMIYMNNGKTIVNDGIADYFLDLETGKIKFWKAAERF